MKSVSSHLHPFWVLKIKKLQAEWPHDTKHNTGFVHKRRREREREREERETHRTTNSDHNCEIASKINGFRQTHFEDKGDDDVVVPRSFNWLWILKSKEAIWLNIIIATFLWEQQTAASSYHIYPYVNNKKTKENNCDVNEKVLNRIE